MPEHSWIETLASQLKQPLPGRTSQLSLLSAQGLKDYEQMHRLSDQGLSRQSGVLLLLYRQEDQFFFPLIRRPEYEGVHSGQIALPGGKAEPLDRDITATALRESQEEIGVDPAHVNILGRLTPLYIPPSRFWVHVTVGYYREGIPPFHPDPREVAGILRVPVNELLNGISVEERVVMTSGRLEMKAPGYVFQQQFIWGATAMILTEFKAIAQEFYSNR